LRLVPKLKFLDAVDVLKEENFAHSGRRVLGLIGVGTKQLPTTFREITLQNADRFPAVFERDAYALTAERNKIAVVHGTSSSTH
jgi:hypothetical protein